MRRAATLIVGGGPAGAAAAIALARRGRPPLLLERHNLPHDALCGGFVSWRTRAQLVALGLDAATLGGEPITEVRLFAGKHRSHAKLPGEALGLSRRRIDEALRRVAAAHGAIIETGVMVRSAESDHVRLADSGEIGFDALFLATGKSDLRGLARPSHADGYMGLRYRFEAAAPLRRAITGAIELHLFRGGYAGLLLQEDGTANLCMAIRRGRLAEAGRDPDALLDRLAADNSWLGERIGAAGACLARDAVGLVPYGWRAGQGVDRLFRLGDQAAVIPSLAGEGMGIALASGTLAADAIIDGGPEAGQAFQRAFSHRAARPLRIAGVIARAGANPAAAPLLLAGARIPGLAVAAARSTRII